MGKSHPLVRNNPHLPYKCSIPGRGYYWFKYPHTLRAARVFLRSLTPTPSIQSVMVRQCPSCHLFVTGAPSPEVDHQGHSPGPSCDLPHHPPPCPGTDRYGNPCLLPPLIPTPEETADATAAPAVVELTLQQQLEKLQKEKEEADKNAELLRLSVRNLQESQVCLH